MEAILGRGGYRHTFGWTLGAVCAVATAFAATRMAAERGFGGSPLASASLALALLFLPFFLLGTTGLAAGLKGWLEERRARIFVLEALLLVPYVVYGLGTDSFSLRSLLKLAAFCLAPTLLLLWAQRSGAPARWQDLLAVAAIWLPFDFRWMRDIWTWPEGVGAYTLSATLGVVLAAVLFVSLRGLDGVGYRFALRRGDLRVILENFLIFAAMGIPIGLATGFLAVTDRTPDLFRFVGNGLGLLLLVAIPEELLFRGLILNLLQRILSPGRALFLASVLFGAAHLNNGPHPDWRYFLLATIAGAFYGRAYRRSGGLMAAAIVHTLVDAVWSEFFR